MTATYIVTIERNADKARLAQQTMAGLGVEATLYMGVDGAAGPIKYSAGEGYIHSLARVHHWRHLGGTDIGCYLSHYRLWHHALEQGHERIVVFEDDVVPMPNFGSALSRLAAADERYEYIDLAPSAFRLPVRAEHAGEVYSRAGVAMGDGVQLLPAMMPLMGMYAYSVSRIGLRKLCGGGMMPIKQTIDKELRAHTIDGTLKRYMLLPGIVSVDPPGGNAIDYGGLKEHRFLRKRWRLFSMIFQRGDMRRHYTNKQREKRQLAEYPERMIRDVRAGVFDQPRRV